MGTLFVFWPCVWAATMAAYSSKLPIERLVVIVGTLALACVLVNTTICTLNDIADRKIDAQVERTRKRPLPSGRISLSAALMFLLAQVLGCLAMVKIWARDDVTPYALITLFPLHGLYPFMKRLTYWPQAWLGLSAAFGGVVAWQHIVGNVNWGVLVPYITGVISWVIYYDTVYATQDKKDDLKLGLGSTAVLFGNYLKPLLAFFAFLFVALFAYAGYVNQQGAPFYMVSILSAVIHLASQLGTVNFDDRASCMKTFLSNEQMGYLIWGGILLDYARNTGYLPTVLKADGV